MSHWNTVRAFELGMCGGRPDTLMAILWGLAGGGVEYTTVTRPGVRMK